MNLLGIGGSEWAAALGSILLVNVLLSGDNAVVIALASKNLSPKQRTRAIFWGSAGAVVLRVIFTLAAAALLDIPYLQLVAGIALVWVAISLTSEKKHLDSPPAAADLLNAIKVILFADLVMSLDNVLALAAIAQTVPSGKYSLIIVGLATSIPLVVFGAQILMKLMDRYPIIIYLGAGVLGYAAAELIVSDAAVGPRLVRYHILLKAVLTLIPVIVGYWRRRARADVKPARD